MIGNEDSYERWGVWETVGVGEDWGQEIIRGWRDAAGKICGDTKVSLFHLFYNHDFTIAIAI